MDIKYSLTEEDYIDFSIKNMRNISYFLKMFILRKLVTSIIILSFAYIFFDLSKYSISRFIFIFLSLILLICFFEFFILMLILRKNIRSDLEKDKKILGERILSIREDGLYDLSSGGENFIDWQDVKFVDETKGYVYIFILSQSGYIIPNVFFRDDLEKGRFVDKIRSYIDY